MTLIEEMFRESPFEPLRHHMKTVIECVKYVRPMFEAVRDEKHDALSEVARRVFKAEHEADKIKDEIRRVLPKRFFLPVYRGDLLGYLKMQDDMADSVEDVAVLLTLKPLRMHAQLIDPTLVYVDKVVEVCHGTQEIADYLPALVAGDMAGDEAEHTLKLVAGLDRSEWEADRLQYTVSQTLFSLEDELKATDILLWFKVFGELGQLANSAEKSGERLRRMLSTSNL